MNNEEHNDEPSTGCFIFWAAVLLLMMFVASGGASAVEHGIGSDSADRGEPTKPEGAKP